MKKCAIPFVAALVLVFGAACNVTQQPGGEDEPEDGGGAETTVEAAAGVTVGPEATLKEDV